MGKVWEYLNYGMSKKEWEQQQLVNKLREKDFCSSCGKRTEIICQSKSIMGNCEKALCSDCAKKCKSCGKHFCSRHIHKHKCR